MRLAPAISTLIELAGTALHSLECHFLGGTFAEKHGAVKAVRQIRTLTALTRLELVGFAGEPEPVATHLRALPLRELVLVKCFTLVLGIFAPGALMSLEKLHLVGGRRKTSSARLQSCAEVVLSLPHLMQVSGCHPLFGGEGMENVLSTWWELGYTEGLMSATNESIFGPMRLWQRPVA